MTWLRVMGIGLRLQCRLIPRSPGDLAALIVAPLTTTIFLAIVDQAGKPELVSYAVLAPALMTLWAMALLVGGDMIDAERAGGTLEKLVAAPAGLLPLLFGRMVAVMAVSTVSLAEAWLVAAVFFGIVVPVPHPWIFTAALGVTALAMASWATVMASLFVLARSARTFQNSLTFPFYILGGVLVPVSLLPEWLRPAAALVFLSWSADLLRDALAYPEVTLVLVRLSIIFAFAVLGVVLGHVLLTAVLRRVRALGTLTYS